MTLLSQCFIYKDFSFVIKLCCSSFSTTWYFINIFCGLKFLLSCSSLCVEGRKPWRTVYYLTQRSKCLKFMEKPMSSPVWVMLSKVAQPPSGPGANVGSTCRNQQPQLPSPGWLQREAPAWLATAGAAPSERAPPIWSQLFGKCVCFLFIPLWPSQFSRTSLH